MRHAAGFTLAKHIMAVRTASMTGDRVQWGMRPYSSSSMLPACRGLITLLLCCSSIAHAARQDLDRIYRAVEQFVQQQLQASNTQANIELGKLETRLYLPQCRQLEAYLPADSRLAGKTRIGVHCLQPIEWSIMVPVTISTNASVVVLVRPVRSGQEISADDLGMRQLGTGETAPAATLISADQAIGKVAVTTLGKGLALRSDMLRAPYIVQQNQTVTLVADGNGFRVSNTGRALGNASKGQPVQVRSSAGQIVRGIAESPGVVAVER